METMMKGKPPWGKVTRGWGEDWSNQHHVAKSSEWNTIWRIDIRGGSAERTVLASI